MGPRRWVESVPTVIGQEQWEKSPHSGMVQLSDNKTLALPDCITAGTGVKLASDLQRTVVWPAGCVQAWAAWLLECWCQRKQR